MNKKISVNLRESAGKDCGIAKPFKAPKPFPQICADLLADKRRLEIVLFRFWKSPIEAIYKTFNSKLKS